MKKALIFFVMLFFLSVLASSGYACEEIVRKGDRIIVYDCETREAKEIHDGIPKGIPSHVALGIIRRGNGRHEGKTNHSVSYDISFPIEARESYESVVCLYSMEGGWDCFSEGPVLGHGSDWGLTTLWLVVPFIFILSISVSHLFMKEDWMKKLLAFYGFTLAFVLFAFLFIQGNGYVWYFSVPFIMAFLALPVAYFLTGCKMPRIFQGIDAFSSFVTECIIFFVAASLYFSNSSAAVMGDYVTFIAGSCVVSFFAVLTYRKVLFAERWKPKTEIQPNGFFKELTFFPAMLTKKKKRREIKFD